MYTLEMYTVFRLIFKDIYICMYADIWVTYLTSAPIGARNCNFPPFLGNYDKQTVQPTDRPTDRETGSYTFINLKRSFCD